MPGDHPDRIRWNAKYAAGFVPSFRPHPLAARALALGLPDGPVADLACGPSGAALLAAEQGRRVTAVDVSEVALGLLGAEARRRGLGHLITLVHADLSAWAPEPRSHALVLGIGFWDAAVFRAAAAAVADGGLLAWEALTADARRSASRPPAGVLRRSRRARLPSARRLHPHRPERRPRRERREMLARVDPGIHVLLGRRRGVMELSEDEYPVWKKGADEYPAPPRVVGPGALFVRHRHRRAPRSRTRPTSPRRRCSPGASRSVRTAACCSGR